MENQIESIDILMKSLFYSIDMNKYFLSIEYFPMNYFCDECRVNVEIVMMCMYTAPLGDASLVYHNNLNQHLVKRQIIELIFTYFSNKMKTGKCIDSDEDFDLEVVSISHRKPPSSSLTLSQGDRVSVRDGENIKIESLQRDGRIKKIEDVPDIVLKYCLDDSMKDEDIKKILDNHKNKKKNNNTWDPMIFKHPNGKYSSLPLDPNNLALVQYISSDKEFMMEQRPINQTTKQQKHGIIQMDDIDAKKSPNNDIVVDTSYDKLFAGKLSQKSIDILIPTRVLTSSSKMINIYDEGGLDEIINADKKKKNNTIILEYEKHADVQSGSFTLPILDVVEAFADSVSSQCVEDYKRGEFKREYLKNKQYDKFVLLKDMMEIFNPSTQIQIELNKIHMIFCKLYDRAIQHYNKVTSFMNILKLKKNDISSLSDTEFMISVNQRDSSMSAGVIMMMARELSCLVPMEDDELFRTTLQNINKKQNKNNGTNNVSNEALELDELDSFEVDDISVDGDEDAEMCEGSIEERIAENEYYGDGTSSTIGFSRMGNIESGYIKKKSDKKIQTVSEFDNEFSYLWRIINMYYCVDLSKINKSDDDLLGKLENGIFSYDNIVQENIKYIEPAFDTMITDIFKLAQTPDDLKLYVNNEAIENFVKIIFFMTAILEKQKTYMNDLYETHFYWQSDRSSFVPRIYPFSNYFKGEKTENEFLKDKSDILKYEIINYDGDQWESHTKDIVELQQSLNGICDLLKNYISKIKSGITRDDIAIELVCSSEFHDDHRHIEHMILSTVFSTSFFDVIFTSFKFIKGSMVLSKYKRENPSLFEKIFKNHNEDMVFSDMKYHDKISKNDDSYKRIIEIHDKVKIMDFLLHEDIFKIFTEYISIQIRFNDIKSQMTKIAKNMDNPMVSMEQLRKMDTKFRELKKEQVLFTNHQNVLLLEGFYKIKIFTKHVNEHEYYKINRNLYKLKHLIHQNKTNSMTEYSESYKHNDEDYRKYQEVISLHFSYSDYLRRCEQYKKSI